ncbi:sal-like protein 4 [Sinocyclocheilus grahami]|uniref:Sal-like protein 4 n=1 Tax=Sinocyclocheilus grahami TaxID=75366 RepID=A0A672LWQ4_SINGR|nr:PREDICTED: sal-like protein 4 [Sinocyclocheilus grahami]
MSRRKQKRPQQLVNADPGGTRLMPQDDQLPVKSPSTSLASEATSSSLSSSPTSLQDCQPPLAPRPSPGGLHAPSLPNESSSPPHWPNHIASYSTSLPNAHSSLSPDFPHPSLSSQTHSPPPSQQKCTYIPSHQPHSTVTSPPMGISATTTTSSSSSLSSSLSLGAPPHQGSPSPIHQTPLSPSEQLQVPPTLAVLLEELRVLQQRQIHQMQITEEICRQVLRLGGMVSAQDAPQGSVEGHQSDAGSSSPPNTGASLIPQAPTSKPNQSHTNGSRASYSTTSSLTSSSSLVTSSASMHPLSLTLGLLPRYLNETSPNTSISHGNGMNFPTPPLPTVSLSQDQLSASLSSTVSMSNGSSSSSSGRQQHICRFCGKVLSSDSSLQIHLRSHTGERPYQCPVCLSRFTTRGNLKAHFLRHREQNPELSLSLLPPALSEQSQSGSGSGPSQRRRKRRAEDEEPFGVKGSVGVPDSLALGFLSGSSHPSPSSLPLPPSVDLALLSTAHSLLQLNRASAAAAASVSTSVLSSSSITSSAMTGQFKGAKQQRFDENTPPHSTLHPGSPYSQLAHLPKILFPSGPSAHHPSLALLRPPHLPSPHLPLTFPFSSYHKPQNSSPPSSSPSSSSATSDTSKLQRLAQKLEKQPLPKSTNEGQAQANDISTTSNANVISAYRREMMAALGLNPNPSGEPASQKLQGSTASSLVPNQCGVCLRVLSCPRALRLHQATHLGERPFPCKLCGRSFSTKGSLRAHLATHRARPANARGQNSCPLCHRKFTNAVVLQHHIRMHLGGQLPPEGNGDLQSEEDPGQMDGVSLPKNLQSLPLNMSMSSSASLLESGASLRDTASGDADQLMESDQDPYDNTPETSPTVTLEKEGPSGENSPPDNSDENHYGTVHQSKSQVVNGSAEEDEDTPLSLCTRTNSQDTLFDKKWHNGASHQTVISRPKTSLNSEALNLSPALTPPSSPGLSTESKSDQSSEQTTLHVNGIDHVLEPNDADSHQATENASLHIPDRAVDQKRKAEDSKESAEEDQRKDREKTEVTSSETPVAPPQPQRSEKPYSCTECGKEYASRSGLKGHMKIHSGSMNQLASTASSQSSEGKVVECAEELTHQKVRGEDAKNMLEKSTNNLSLSEHPVSTTDDRPEDTA